MVIEDPELPFLNIKGSSAFNTASQSSKNHEQQSQTELKQNPYDCSEDEAVVTLFSRRPLKTRNMAAVHSGKETIQVEKRLLYTGVQSTKTLAMPKMQQTTYSEYHQNMISFTKRKASEPPPLLCRKFEETQDFAKTKQMVTKFTTVVKKKVENS